MVATLLAIALAFPADAKALLEQSLAEMGGREAFTSIKTVSATGSGHILMLEQSERPTGPWIPMYGQFTESVDLIGGCTHVEAKYGGSFTPEPFPTKTITTPTACSSSFGSSVAGLQKAEERLELGPERVILTALASTTLKKEADITY